MSHPLFAGILVGGRGRRLGNRDKASLPHPNGGRFVDHMVELVSPMVTSVILAGRPDQDPLRSDCQQLVDPYPDLGPAAGLVALLEAAPAPWCLLLPCDLPKLGRAVLDELVRQPRGDTPLALRTEAWLHPSVGLYPCACAARVREQVEGGDRALHRIFEALGGQSIPVPPGLEDQLDNINTPDDLDRLG